MPLNAEYARELRAVFKILEFSIGVGLIVSIVVADRYRITVAGAFLTFFALVGALTSLFFFVVHLSSLIYKIPGPVTLIEFISIKLCAILALIAMIITAATGGGSAAPIASAIPVTGLINKSGEMAKFKTVLHEETEVASDLLQIYKPYIYISLMNPFTVNTVSNPIDFICSQLRVLWH
uniref:MARVEL domain-containing protein n=1 Tax=Schistosoma mansoni TaxID=6183 RepID=A0A5K4EDF6_SCHMA